MARTIVYVDGFNLYHGAKELIRRQTPGSQWKWLDIRALAQRLVPEDQIDRLRYFTARVSAPDHDPGIQQRQQIYLRALESRDTTSIHLGQFKLRKTRMPLAQKPSSVGRLALRVLGQRTKVHPDGNISIEVWRTEEKGSDVNLATYLLHDAFSGNSEKAMVVSNDTDLCEPIRLVTEELNVPLIVVNPRGHTQPANALKKVATETRRIRASALTESQFPDTLSNSRGRITKPAEW